MQTVYVAIGTNQGEREVNIENAILQIREIPETLVGARSDFKEYAPEDPNAGQANYLNGVVKLSTDLGPLDLLHKLQVIERRMGRSTKGDGAARPIDLDVLSYGNEVIIQGKTLTIPHPRMTARLFVLEPLVQVAPEWKDPRTGRTAVELLEKLTAAAKASDESSAPSLESEARA